VSDRDVPVWTAARHYTHAPWPWRWWLLLAVSILVCLFLVVPVFIVVAMSFSNTSYLVFPPHGFSLRWYGSFFGSEQWMDAGWVSLRAAFLTAVLSLILGTGGAFAFVRGRFVGRSAAYVAALLPMIVPVIVTAVAIYSLFSRLHLVGTWWGFAVADTVIAVPIVVLIVSAALEGVNVSLERAAMILGASPLRALWEVTLPILAPALAAGALFAFITSFDESVISLFLSTTLTATLPKVMWDNLRFEISPTISAIAALLVGLSALTLVVGGILIGRRAERMGV
jgi:ABC-type spermidine/putrescine transport system permease subunit II